MLFAREMHGQELPFDRLMVVSEVEPLCPCHTFGTALDKLPQAGKVNTLCQGTRVTAAVGLNAGNP